MADLDGLREYATARGNSAPALADAEQVNAALVRGTDHIKFHYQRRFMAGLTVDQDDLDAAIYEAAILELAKPDFFNKTFTPSQQKVLTQVGDIKWSPIGGASGSMAATPTSTRIDGILSRYMFHGLGGLVV